MRVDDDGDEVEEEEEEEVKALVEAALRSKPQSPSSLANEEEGTNFGPR